MAGHALAQLDPPERRRLNPLAGKLIARGLGAAAVGFLVLAVLWLIGGAYGLERVLYAYLANFAFFFSISIGGVFFVLIHFLCRTGTVTTYRRIGEIIAATTPIMAIFVIPILLGVGAVYHWSHATVADGYSESKLDYLSGGWFAVRVILGVGLLSWMGWYFFSRSRRQDESADPKITLRLQGISGPAIIVYAFMVTLLSFDLLMSLDSHWYSTIFGVYYFAGGFMALHCLLALGIHRLQERGLLRSSVNAEHFHDIGKMMFAFVVFWAYIGFSQYMLIWYAAIPEETVWYMRHGAGFGDGVVAGSPFPVLLLVLLLGHFVIPFVGLLSREVKRRPARLARWAVWLLVMHWLDMIWLVRPELRLADGVTTLAVNWVDMLALIAGLLALGGVFLAALAKVGSNVSLVAQNDPRLVEAMVFENF